MSLSVTQLKSLQRLMWSTGDYASIATHYESAAEDLVARADIAPGMRVLDVATGTGNVALRAAKAGGHVDALDLTPELFDIANARADELGLQIAWQEGDAESLPYDDAAFDRVLSAFGVMFAPRQRRAARELVRVCRPGGMIAVCNWAATGLVGAVYDTFDSYLPADSPWGAPSANWGDPEKVRANFDGLGVDLAFDSGAVSWVFSSPEDCVRYMEEVSGPVIAARQTLLGLGHWDEARQRMLTALEPMMRADVGGLWIRAEYLVTIGRVPA